MVKLIKLRGVKTHVVRMSGPGMSSVIPWTKKKNYRLSQGRIFPPFIREYPERMTKTFLSPCKRVDCTGWRNKDVLDLVIPHYSSSVVISRCDSRGKKYVTIFYRGFAPNYLPEDEFILVSADEWLKAFPQDNRTIKALNSAMYNFSTNIYAYAS